MSAIRTKLHCQTRAGITDQFNQWNTKLRELVNESRFPDILSHYLQMLRSGVTPRASTFRFALKSAAALSLPFTGQQIHCQVIRTGCLSKPFVQTSLISMYSKCGSVDIARKVFDENPDAWELTACFNALIAGYSLNRRVNDAVFLFSEMRELDVPIDRVTMLGLLPVCRVPGNLGLGICLHCCCLKSGLILDWSVGDGFLSIYFGCGELISGRRLFCEMAGEELIAKLHSQARSSEIAGRINQWNAQLRELANKSLFSDTLSLYLQMLRSGATPNASTFPFVLKSSAALSLPLTGQQIHCQVIRTGCLSEVFVQTSLISMYSKCGSVDVARKVFDENPHSRELTASFNALIAGYSLNLRVNDALFLFSEMKELAVPIDGVTMLGLVPVYAVPGNLGLGICVHCCCVKSGLILDLSVGSGLLSMYLRCGEIISGRKLFDEMPGKGLITWNAMINGYAQNGMANDALDLYREMDSRGIHPNSITLVGLLSSCANLGALGVGMEIERRINDCGVVSDPYLNSALINMYARCGNLMKARQIFDNLPVKSLISWTAIIGGYGMHGRGEISVKLFDEMIETGTRPDETAFVNVLSACSHAGLTEKGLNYFNTMEDKYRLRPGPEHCACVVDLLGRAGRLDDAHRLIESMKSKPDGAVWGALLGACKIHKNVDLAELAFARAIEFEPTNIGYYVLLSNIYTDAGNLEGVSRIRLMIRDRELKKDPGCSYVEHEGRVHLFLSGDKSHPQSKQIYRFLDKLEGKVKELDSLTTTGNDQSRTSEQRMMLAAL